MSSPRPSLPDAFVARLHTIVPPAHLDAVLASFGVDKPLCARHNPLRGPLDAALAALAASGATPVPLDLGAGFFRLDLPPGVERRAVTDGDAVTRGLVHLQNPSSWIPVLALGVAPDDQVLDLCAAPGGKTLHLAGLLGPGGHLAAVEPVKPRFFKLRGVLERGGALAAGRSLRLFMKDGRGVGGAVPARFDKVLVDAPCSSEARFDALDPTTFVHWSARKIADCAYKQKALLRSGLAALRPGGALVYSTCSFAPEENEAVVQEVLAELGGAVVAEPVAPRLPALPPDWTPGLAGLDAALRVLPGPLWDGFFVARLVKRQDAPAA